MSRIDDNKLAKEITKREGKIIRVNIAQVKEVLKCTKESIKSMYYNEEIQISDVLRWLGW